MTAFPSAVRAAAILRSEGRCENCGLIPGTQLHHRQYVSRGGQSVIQNAAWLCGMGNQSGCHGMAHTIIGEQTGLSIRSGYDPTVVPIFNRGTRLWYLFTPDGGRVHVDPVVAVAVLVSMGAIRAGAA